MTRHATRDTQRSRVYAAEQMVRSIFDLAARTPGRQVEIFGSRLTLPEERRVVSLESIKTYADTVLALPAVRARYDRAAVAVTVRDRRGPTRAHYEPATATIAIPLHNRAQLRELVILHELAHHLQPFASEPGHGAAFTAILCHLLEIALGTETAWLMRACLADAGAHID
ncbi:TIGR04338 family metallohydrolase (plasmid) [Nocardia sp. NBC_01377]|uniref:TIGR04338 family metallohydrolase n=1 Tax=Nocardia sp. NBC_01377 TaxID=2903595 RepID=UPI002F910A76